MSGGGAAEPTCGLAEILVFLGALVAGTSCSLCSKVLLSMRSVGLSGQEEAFQNPLFQTWGMFLGMVFALPVHFAREALARRRRKRGYTPVDAVEFKEMPASTYALLAIPSLFDLAATALCMFGLTYIAVSVYQMLRGAAIVFVAVLKHFVLKDKLAGFMWVGVGLNVVSILLVGATASAGDGDGATDKNPLVGVGLILAGAFVQSLQYAFEEKVMSSDVGAPPLLVIGMEGFWGFFVCTFVLYPALYAAGVEDPFDTWEMFKNSSEIQGMFLLYFVSIFAYNLLAVLVTFMLNSVWHAILDNFRPISVWGLDLFLFYIISRGVVGEAWVWPGSYVQVLALIVLLYGTAVYNGSIKVPGCEYPPEPSLVPPSPLPVVRASPALQASSLLKSPLIHGTPASRRPSGASPRAIPTITEMPGRGRAGSM